jgi:hypothetical protein
LIDDYAGSEFNPAEPTKSSVSWPSNPASHRHHSPETVMEPFWNISVSQADTHTHQELEEVAMRPMERLPGTCFSDASNAGLSRVSFTQR